MTKFMPMAKARRFLFAGVDSFRVQTMTPIESITTLHEHTNIHPGVLAKKDQASDLVAARYRLISDRNTPATAAYRAKTMAIVMTILGYLPSLPWSKGDCWSCLADRLFGVRSCMRPKRGVASKSQPPWCSLPEAEK